MSMIIPAQGLPDLAPIRPEAPSTSGNNGFSQLLEHVSDLLSRADQLASGYAQGQVGLTEAVLASTKADTEFQTLMAVRNRALSAYQEIMNLQV
jgi:flagellar hook-basal body complex protein FliE